MKIDNLFSLRNKIALVTGATGHLGFDMSLALAAAGAHVLVNSRSHDKAEAISSKLNSQGFSSEPAVFDVTSAEQIKEFFSSYKEKLNVIVNNAYSGQEGTLATAEEKDFHSSYNHTVIAAFLIMSNGMKALRNAVKEDGEASIINISSMYGVVSPKLSIYESPSISNPPFYGAAKAGLIQLTKYAAIEHAPNHIRVNSISPGPFPPKEIREDRPELYKNIINNVPLGREGDSSEIQGPVLFLASRASSYVTGANLIVDGGWTAV